MTEGSLLHHRPSKRKMVQPFRGAWRGGMTDDGSNSLVPSPIKMDNSAVISYRIARWKSLPEVTDGGRLRCKLSARDTKKAPHSHAVPSN